MENTGKVAYRSAFYEQDTHFTIPFQSLYDGLLFVFEGYSFPYQTFLKQGSEGISRHYEQLFSKLNTNLLPPGKILHQAGLYLLQNPVQADRGLDLLRLNERYYPYAPAVHRTLAKVYQSKGDKNNAIGQYKKLLAINDGNEQARKSITELSKK